MGNGEWGMGNGEWGIGNRESGIGNRESGIGNGESGWGIGNGESGIGNGLRRTAKRRRLQDERQEYLADSFPEFLELLSFCLLKLTQTVDLQLMRVTIMLRLLRTFAGVLQEKIYMRATLKENMASCISLESLINVNFGK